LKGNPAQQDAFSDDICHLRQTARPAVFGIASLGFALLALLTHPLKPSWGEAVGTHNPTGFEFIDEKRFL
jgi:hypothetical protein